jgi:hypothetical protein
MNIFIKNIFISLFFSFIFIFFFSCSNKKERILDKNEFIDIYSDLILINSNPKYSNEERKQKADELFNKNNINQKAIWNTVNKFNEYFDDWRDIYKEIISQIEIKKQKFIKKI